MSCPFCQYTGPSPVLADFGQVAFIIEPLNPVTPGHVLVVARRHLMDALTDLVVTGQVFEIAAACQRASTSGTATSSRRLVRQRLRRCHISMCMWCHAGKVTVFSCRGQRWWREHGVERDCHHADDP